MENRFDRRLARRNLLTAGLALADASGFPPLGAASVSAATRFEASHDAMGTLFTIVAYGPDRDTLAQSANAAFDEIDRLDAQMSNYQAASELSRFNRDAARRAVTVEPRLFDLIADAAEIAGDFSCRVQRRGIWRATHTLMEMKLFQSPFVILRTCFLAAAVWAGVCFQFSGLAFAQGTGEWDGVMNPEAEEHHRLGLAAMSRGDWKEARREFRKALKFTPRAVPVFNSLGEMDLATGEIDRAVVNFRIAIALGPLFAPAYGNMGRALERRKDLEGARDFYEGALRLKSDWPEIRLALGTVLSAQGHLERAQDEFKRVVDADPENVEARYQWGRTLLALDDAAAAAAELRRVLEARPKDALAQYDLGRALMRLGRQAEADAAFGKARELDPSLPPPPR